MSSSVEILLVEDNPQDAELTVRALKKSNLANKLVHLRDGAEALDFLFGQGLYRGEADNNRPRVILLDLKMPKVSGVEVLRVIKSDLRTKDIPVVMLTSSKEDPDIKECYGLGANSYVVKPMDFGQFTNAVCDLGLYWMVVNQASR